MSHYTVVVQCCDVVSHYTVVVQCCDVVLHYNVVVQCWDFFFNGVFLCCFFMLGCNVGL